MKFPNEIIRACDAIKHSDFLMITAGAGMSVDSGLPDFRGPQGFWRAYPPMAKLGLTFPEASNPSWFHKDPTFGWGFFGHRFMLYSNSTPHPGYSILQSWCRNKDYFIFTSNVDGHFAKSGFPEEKIAECHGSINFLQCLETYKCGLQIWPMQGIKVNMETFRAEEPLPLCISCGGLARPNILMFGDYGWVGDRTEQQMVRLEEAVNKKKWKITVIEIGAGEAVYTVRRFGQNLADRERAKIVRINPSESVFSSDEHVILVKMGALEALIQINNAMHE